MYNISSYNTRLKICTMLFKEHRIVGSYTPEGASSSLILTYAALRLEEYLSNLDNSNVVSTASVITLILHILTGKI